MTRRLSTAVVCLCMLVSFRPAAAQYCHVAPSQGIRQLHLKTWCFFACLDFVCDQISMGYYQQCDFAQWAYALYPVSFNTGRSCGTRKPRSASKRHVICRAF